MTFRCVEQAAETEGFESERGSMVLGRHKKEAGFWGVGVSISQEDKQGTKVWGA